MKSLLLDAYKGLEVVDINDFHDILDAINAGCFDVIRLQIGSDDKAIYDIYCDDDGLFKSDTTATAYSKNLEPLLVGNLLIAQSDDSGEQIPLTNDDIEYIAQFVLRFNHHLPGKEPFITYCLIHTDYAGRFK